jgi:replicative DNA helicase
MYMQYVTPQNAEAEQAVLGCMIMDNDKISDVADILEPDDFYRDQNKTIYSAIITLNSQRIPADMVEIADQLTKAGQFDAIGGYEYLQKMCSMVPTTENAVHYASLVQECSKRRKLIKVSQDSMDAAFGNNDINELLDKVEKDVLAINSEKGSAFRSAADIAVESMNMLEKRCNNKGKISGIPTGFTDLDFKLGGLQDGDLCIIAARPSMGKTALAEDIALHVSCFEELPTAFFSLEMSGASLVSRAFSSLGMVDNARMKLGYIEEGDWQNIADALAIISNGKLIIDDTSHIKVTEIRSKCRRIKNKLGSLRLIVVDHLTEMWRPCKRDDRLEHEDNVRALKRLAKEMNCPVILLQQLNRLCETRQDKRPMLSDLKETGASEEAADVVLFIYRDDYYKPDSEKKNIAEVNVAKGRNVGTGVVELRWFGEYTKFANLKKDDAHENKGYNRPAYRTGKQRRKMPDDESDN